MIHSEIPSTPFSTCLSGSAKETEGRLKNLFSGPKKRPPVLLLALAYALCLLCGNLVSCRREPGLAVPGLVMETQYYDTYGNYVEIPALVLPAGEENEAEVLALAETTREELFQTLEEFIAADLKDPRELYRGFDPLHILGFRIQEDGTPVFYLSAVVDGRDLGEGGFLDEWVRLYIWDSGKISRYSCMALTTEDAIPLVPEAETVPMDPPLWSQWHHTGLGPTGGFTQRFAYVPGEDPDGENFYSQLMECYAQYQTQWTVYYADSHTERDTDGCLRVGPAT